MARIKLKELIDYNWKQFCLDNWYNEYCVNEWWWDIEIEIDLDKLKKYLY